MKTRKVISAILAGACAISALSFTATAADKSVKSVGTTPYKISASIAAPELNVTIPSGVTAVVNPYGTAVTVKGVTYDAGVSSAIYHVRNLTTSCAVDISGLAVVETTTNVPVKSRANLDDGKLASKGFVAWIKAGKEDELHTYTDTKYADELDESGASVLAEKLTDTECEFATGATEYKTILTLPKGTMKKNDANKDVQDKYALGAFQVTGVAGGKAADWDTKADKVNLTLTLNITPAADEA